jgi:exodeoxyribonuclease VII small subunit
VPLDEALALYERGEALHRALSERLDRAELRIEELRPEGEPDPRDSGPPAG